MLEKLHHWLRRITDKVPKARASADTFLLDQVNNLIELIPSSIEEGTHAQELLAQTLYETGLANLSSGFPASAARALSSAQSLGFDAPAFDYNLALA